MPALEPAKHAGMMPYPKLYKRRRRRKPMRLRRELCGWVRTMKKEHPIGLSDRALALVQRQPWSHDGRCQVSTAPHWSVQT